ncbi:integrase catalytic domain-containing protein [Trichonephila clavipes]|nr:integrase catalytic domain-containing protein [Trichonephila clavipes]
MLNSRPPCPVSANENDFEVLTPAHFLINRSLNSIIEPNLINIKESHLRKWEKITRTVRLMWKFWHRNYLNQMQQRYKWMFENNNVKVGDLVLVKNNFNSKILRAASRCWRKKFSLEPDNIDFPRERLNSSLIMRTNLSHQPPHHAAVGATKTDQFPYSLIHQSAVVESDQRVTFKSGILSAFKIEFKSRAPTQQAISSRRGILKSLRGAALDFALTRITLTLESTIDRAKTHPAYDPCLHQQIHVIQ